MLSSVNSFSVLVCVFRDYAIREPSLGSPRDPMVVVTSRAVLTPVNDAVTLRASHSISLVEGSRKLSRSSVCRSATTTLLFRAQMMYAPS
jgi:hypothetical protein